LVVSSSTGERRLIEAIGAIHLRALR